MKVILAALAACAGMCLAPATAFAAANPNNHGHHYHYGWVHKHTAMPPTPAPTPAPSGGGKTGGKTGGLNGYFGAAPAALAPAPATGTLPTLPVFQPGTISTSGNLMPSVPDAWLVAILLASVVAANVAFAVWATGRGGHVVLRRALAPVGLRI